MITTDTYNKLNTKKASKNTRHYEIQTLAVACTYMYRH